MGVKKIHFLLCLLAITCSIAVPAFSKGKDSKGKEPESYYLTVKYDFLNPDLKPPTNKIKYRQGVVLVVTNFNPFLYDLTINGQVVSYNQNFPTLLTTALAGAAPNTTEAQKKAAEAKREAEKVRAKPELAINDAIRTAAEKVEAFQDERLNFENALKKVYTNVPRAESTVIKSVGLSDGLPKDQIRDHIVKDLEDLIIVQTDSSGKPSSKPPAYEQLRNALLCLINNVRDGWIKLNNIYQSLGNDKDKYKDDYDAENVRWKTFEGTDEARLKEALNRAADTWKALEYAPFEIQGGPFFADGDELILKITVSRRAGLDASFLTSRVCSEKPVARFRAEGGIKIDFSAGFAFGWPADRSYYLDPKNNNYIARNKDAEAFCAVLPALFIHVHPRTQHDIILAGTFGLGMNKANVFDYYVGISGLFGAAQRAVLTACVGLRTINVLSGGLKEGDPLPAGVTTIPVTGVLKLGFCVGLSFNLGGI